MEENNIYARWKKKFDEEIFALGASKNITDAIAQEITASSVATVAIMSELEKRIIELETKLAKLTEEKPF